MIVVAKFKLIADVGTSMVVSVDCEGAFIYGEARVQRRFPECRLVGC
jgi:hypothetical protein